VGYPERGERRELSHAAQGAFVVLAIMFGALMFFVGLYVGENSEPERPEAAGVTTIDTGVEEETEPATTEAETETETEAAGGGAADGEAVFAEAGCGSCHTLEEAGSSGTIGPSLDETQLDRAQIEEQVRKGSGAMPPFEGTLTDEQIAAVAEFVEASKG
jgi:mono/diheme cytochrome c family protein